MLDLRQLRQFVAVAEAEHVGRAAERLHMSQSPLSRQVMQLEDALGLPLFERAKKRVRLTAEGRTFLDEARELLAQADRVEALGRQMGRGETGTLALGYVEGAVHAGLLGEQLRRLRRRQAALRIELTAQRSGPLLDALRAGMLHGALVYSRPATDDAELAHRQVFDEAMLLAVPATHALARKRQIKPADLDGQAWITRPRAANPRAHDELIASCRAAGFTPDLRYEAADPVSGLGLVAAGLGFALVQASIRKIWQSPEVALVKLPWYPARLSIFAAWRRAEASPLLTQWLSVLPPGPQAA